MRDYLERPVLTSNRGIINYAFVRGMVLPPVLGSREGVNFDIASDSPVKTVHFSYSIPVHPKDEVILARPLFIVSPPYNPALSDYTITIHAEIPQTIKDVELLRLERDGEVIGYWSDIPANAIALPASLVEKVEPASWIEDRKLRTNPKTLDIMALEFPSFK